MHSSSSPSESSFFLLRWLHLAAQFSATCLLSACSFNYVFVSGSSSVMFVCIPMFFFSTWLFISAALFAIISVEFGVCVFPSLLIRWCPLAQHLNSTESKGPAVPLGIFLTAWRGRVKEAKEDFWAVTVKGSQEGLDVGSYWSETSRRVISGSERGVGELREVKIRRG